MTDVVDAWLAEADAAIADMKAAAIRARALHARAELMRHMRGTAAKVANRPLDEAARLVADEWMKAWHLDGAFYDAFGQEVRRFTLAFCQDSRAGTPATQQEITDSAAALDAAFARHGTSIADQMAWRSHCAHGWWEAVEPAPADLPGRPDRPGMPLATTGAPFWTAGCAERCR